MNNAPVAQMDRAPAFQWGHDLWSVSEHKSLAELIPKPAQKISQEIFKRLGEEPTLGAFIGK